MAESAATDIWVEKTAIHGEWKKPGTSSYSLGSALVSPQEAAGGQDFYWALRDADVGDIVLHLLQDEYTIAGASVVDSELITDHQFPEYIRDRWEPQQQEQGGYLRKLRGFTRFETPLELRTDLFDNPTYRDELKQIREDNKHLFYTKRLSVVQGGYLTTCPDSLAAVLSDASDEIKTVLGERGGIEVSPEDTNHPAGNGRRDEDSSLPSGRQRVLEQWRTVARTQSAGEEFDFVTHDRTRDIAARADEFIVNPSEERFKSMWDRMHSAVQRGNATGRLKQWDGSIGDLAELIKEIRDAEEFDESWTDTTRLGGQTTVWELFGSLHIDEYPIINAATKEGLSFFGYQKPTSYADGLAAFNDFIQIYE